MIKVGDRFESNEGSKCVVVHYVNSNNVTIEFCDDYMHRLTTKAIHIINGQVKNPYYPRIFGVGYFGNGRHRSKEGATAAGFSNSASYSAWTNMLSRCYDKNYIAPHLYENSTVCEEWHNFQVFAEWYTTELNYVGWEGRINTDKDIIGDGSRYSPETCCLVPVQINTSVVQTRNGKFLPGVYKSGKNFRVAPGYDTSTKLFDTELDAHMAFVESKSRRVVEIANEYKNNIKPIVYETLCTKDFRYKFSPYFEEPKSSQMT